jgi:hypothetical protein
MTTVDSDKVVCGGIHAMIVAVLVLFVFRCLILRKKKDLAVQDGTLSKVSMV